MKNFTQKSPLASVFAYVNYRTFLKDLYEHHKLKNPQFSYRLLSRLAGFSSPNFVQLVILKKRNLSNEGAQKIANAFKLTKRETDFFKILVFFNQATTEVDRQKYFKELQIFREFADVKTIARTSLQYLSTWYHAAIRELTLLPDFRENPAWIVRKLNKKITETEAKASLKLLLDLELIKRNSAQKLQPTNKNISTEREIADLSIGHFHRQMLQLAADSIQNTASDDRDISSVTVALDEAAFKEAKKRIQEFRRELNVYLSECKKPTAVYQLNFQIFNLSEIPWQKKPAIKISSS